MKIRIGKKIILTFCLVFTFISLNLSVSSNLEENSIDVSYYHEYPKGSIKRNDLQDIPEEYLLAMVAIHECINLYPQDTKFIQEATWNRKSINYGNYGKSLYQQLNSGEFNGLIDRNFYFDPYNPKHIFALETAKRVIAGHREIKSCNIVGWLTTYDSNKKHVKLAMRTHIATPTYHKFWYK